MNDRYLYRAKRMDNGEWVEGFYFCMEHPDKRHVHHFIIPLGTDLSLGTPIEKIQVEVYENSICRCTGISDKHGNPIFDHDVIKGRRYKDYGQWGEYIDDIKVVIWDDEKAGFDPIYWFDRYSYNIKDYEVIGSAIDNRELLEVGE